MGCDIHIYTEIRPSGKLSWESKDSVEEIPSQDGEIDYDTSSYIHIPRNYNLFALLAKVRGEYDCSLECKKEIPEDASETTQREFKQFGCDGHSHSWLTLTEVKKHLTKIFITSSDVRWAIEDYQHIKDRMENLKTEGMSNEDVRIVFWFDN